MNKILERHVYRGTITRIGKEKFQAIIKDKFGIGKDQKMMLDTYLVPDALQGHIMPGMSFDYIESKEETGWAVVRYSWVEFNQSPGLL